jgi:hypothetical protein
VHVCQGQPDPCRQGIAAGVHVSSPTATPAAATELRANELGAAATTTWTSSAATAEFWVNEPGATATTTRPSPAAATTLITEGGVAPFEQSRDDTLRGKLSSRRLLS